MENPIITVTELSKHLDISPRQIQMYVAQGVLPRVSKGRYRRDDCISAFLSWKVFFGPHTFCGKNDPGTAEYALERFDYQREERVEYETRIHKLEKQIARLEKKLTTQIAASKRKAS